MMCEDLYCQPAPKKADRPMKRRHNFSPFSLLKMKRNSEPPCVLKKRRTSSPMTVPSNKVSNADVYLITEMNASRTRSKHAETTRVSSKSLRKANRVPTGVAYLSPAAAPLRFGDFSPLRSCAPPPASCPPSGSFGMFSTGRKRAWDALDDNLPVTSIPDYSLRPHNGPKRIRTSQNPIPLKFGVKRRLEENEADTDDDIVPADLHPAHKRSRISDVTVPVSPITTQATSNVYTDSLPTPVADTTQLALVPYRSSCDTSPSLHIDEYLRKHLSEVSGDTDIMRDWSRLPSPARGDMVLYNGGRWTPPEIEDVGVCRIEELTDEEPSEEAESNMMDMDE